MGSAYGRRIGKMRGRARKSAGSILLIIAALLLWAKGGWITGEWIYGKEKIEGQN